MRKLRAGQLLLVVVVVVLVAHVVAAWKPVVFIHGLNGSYHDYDQCIALLKEKHPGQAAYALDVDIKWASFKPMAQQVDDTYRALRAVVDANAAAFRGGFTLVGHSQGACVSRALIVLYGAPFNILRFVSLAGAGGGIFGDCGLWLAKNLTCEAATKLMYTAVMQRTFSVANFWKAPNHAEYLAGCTWLPYIDNELAPNATYKKNFLALQDMYFFGSPKDSIIVPWSSSIFEAVAPDGKSVLPLEKQEIWTRDTFGLRTAAEQGRLHRITVEGVQHQQWVNRDDILLTHLFPLLL
jgi:pimeloyl-ACP methyl ester carboxylesterase